MRAALDLGTNSVRLLLAEVSGQTITPLKKEVRVSRLGQAVDSSRALGEAAIARTLDALDDLVAQIPPDVPTTIFATSAVRDAKNSAEFAQLVKKRVGISLEILSGLQEAELSFKGAVLSLSDLNLPDPISVVDIGGGSTELYTGLQGGKLLGGGSAQVGAVRMLERFITKHPLLSEERSRMESEIARLLYPLVQENLRFEPKTLVAVGGTATSLAAMLLDLEKYDDEKVTGYVFSAMELEEIYLKLSRLSLAERREIKTLQAGREDVIVSGAATLVTIAKLIGAKEIIVTAWDLLYGKLVFPVDGAK